MHQLRSLIASARPLTELFIGQSRVPQGLHAVISQTVSDPLKQTPTYNGFFNPPALRFAMDDIKDEWRREALIADLERLAIGWKPSVETLAASPLLDQWSVVFYPATTDLAVQGVVAGHPCLPNGPIITSPICAMNFPDRWVRTQSRFYRLGQRNFDE